MPERPTTRELSVRDHPLRGGLKDRVVAPGGLDPGTRAIIVLVHGYNVNEVEARESYGVYLRHLAARNLPDAERDRIWSFYWPGNVRNTLLSKLSYPLQIRTAQQSAELLSGYLAALADKLRTDLQLTLVAHSLGCRLALELISRIVTSARSYCSDIRLTLMAAAIPIGFLDVGKPLSNGLAHTNYRYCFHSTSDKVLSRAFPAGETVALEGFFPEAVGRHGNPQSASWTGAAVETYYEHGDYWTSDAMAREFIRSKGHAAENSSFERRTPIRDIG